MSPQTLAAKIDHTILKPEATWPQVRAVVEEGHKHKFASVCVAPAFVARVAEMLRGSGVKTCAVAGFPHGTSKPMLKAIEATSAVKDGAEEVDVVAHLPFLLAMDLASAKAELQEVVRAVRAARREAVVKVIVESAALMAMAGEKGEAMIELACQAVRESGGDFIKTSTGFHPAGGASAEAVRLMKKHAGGLQVKASGGIRDLAAARAMLDAGADRLGLSASVAIVNELTGGGAAGAAGGY